MTTKTVVLTEAQIDELKFIMSNWASQCLHNELSFSAKMVDKRKKWDDHRMNALELWDVFHAAKCKQ
jgi:hypothetical protein